MLQTRNGKRTGQAAVRIAVEMVEEGLIDKPTALTRVPANDLDQLLHPSVDPDANVEVIAQGFASVSGRSRRQSRFHRTSCRRTRSHWRESYPRPD